MPFGCHRRHVQYRAAVVRHRHPLRCNADLASPCQCVPGRAPRWGAWKILPRSICPKGQTGGSLDERCPFPLAQARRKFAHRSCLPGHDFAEPAEGQSTLLRHSEGVRQRLNTCTRLGCWMLTTIGSLTQKPSAGFVVAVV